MMMLERRLRRFVPVLQLFPPGLINCQGEGGICDLADAERLISGVRLFLGFFVGTIALLVVFWGAYQFITSAGDPAKAESARKTLFAGLIGVVIVIVAYAFVTVFARQIYGSDIPVSPLLR
jgi:tetrahydromethanopterin S-methyltransferase subunit E